MRKVLLSGITTAALLALAPLFASAHAIGQVYNLPVPLKYYLLGAGATVAVSFVLIGFFLNKAPAQQLWQKTVSLPWLRPVIAVLQIIAVLVLFLAVLAGMFGADDPLRNFTPLFFWVYFLIGVGILHLLIGNLWDAVLNPWKRIAAWLGFNPEKKISGLVSPVLLYGLFWLELVAIAPFLPHILGTALAGYTVLNVIAAIYFENWFRDAELFSVLYGFIGKIAFFKISADGRALVISKPSDKIATAAPNYLLLFAVMLLAGTSFDSFKETRIWLTLAAALHGFAHYHLFESIVLLLFPIPFLAGYLLAVWLMRFLVQTELNFGELARRFSWSLVPIAFGYTLAHNFSLMIVSIPQFSAVLSDPLGLGWNLFHTAQNYGGTIVLSAKLVWFFEIGFVILAHIIGVLFAHLIALRTFNAPADAAKSQYPMVILMVGYTIFTLWLLSLPLVIGG